MNNPKLSKTTRKTNEIMVPLQKHNKIVVQIAEHFDLIDLNIARLRKIVKSVCKRFNLRKATVGIAIVNDSEMKRLNKQFLNRNGTTDCLSFDLTDKQGRKHNKKIASDSQYSDAKIFELVLNGQMAVRQANSRGHSAEAEMALYIVHGLLHNLGFDDSTQKEAKKMHETEDEILQELGYGLVYNKGKRALKT